MQSKITLHIGLYKTATTFLQCRILNAIGVNHIMPHSDEMHQLYDVFENVRYRRLTLLQGRECVKTVLNPVLDSSLVVSNEHLFGHDKNLFSDVEWRFQILEELFDKPNYIITIRRQDAICVSSWYQGVKQKNLTLTFDQFANTYRLNNEKNLMNSDQNFLFETDFRCYNYLKLLAPYLEHTERVTILPIEMLDSEPKEFFRNLLYDFSVGESQINQFIQLSRKEKLNQSNSDHTALFLLNYISAKVFRYPLNAAILRRLHNGYLALNNDDTKKHSWQSPFVVTYLKTIGQLVFRISCIFAPKMMVRVLPSRETKHLILKYHSQSNMKLSETIGIDLGQYEYH